MGGEHTCDRFWTKRLGDHRAGSIGIASGNAAWNPHHFETLTSEPTITLDVRSNSPGMLVHLAIDLDDQPALKANKIHHERSDRMLATEPQSPLLPAPQDSPQCLFGGR